MMSETLSSLHANLKVVLPVGAELLVGVPMVTPAGSRDFDVVSPNVFAAAGDVRIVNAISKVVGGTAGHLAALTSDGSVADGGAPLTVTAPSTLTPRGIPHLTDVQIVYDAADNPFSTAPPVPKVVGGTAGHLVALAIDGSIVDSGTTPLTTAAPSSLTQRGIPHATDLQIVYDASDNPFGITPDNQAAYTPSPLPLAYASAIAIDMSTSNGNGWRIAELTGPLAFGAPTNATRDGQQIKVWFLQDATGGHSITLNAVFITPDAFSAAPNAHSLAVFEYFASDGKWRGGVKNFAS